MRRAREGPAMDEGKGACPHAVPRLTRPMGDLEIPEPCQGNPPEAQVRRVSDCSYVPSR